MDIVIFTETRINSSDSDDIYNINGYRLFKNDVSQGTGQGRPYGGTAVYSRVPLKEGYPCAHNVNGIEFTIIKTESNPHLNIIGVYIAHPILLYHVYCLHYVAYLMKILLRKIL
jgi:hypothetical protein